MNEQDNARVYFYAPALLVVSVLLVPALVEAQVGHDHGGGVEVETRANVGAAVDVGEIRGDAEAQNHSSSRSNRTSGSVGGDSNADVDSDDLPDAAVDGQANAAADITTAPWARGIDVAIDRVGQNENTEVALERLHHISVNAESVRGWNAEEREEVRVRASNATPGTPEFVAASLADLVTEDERVQGVDIVEDRAEIRYQARMRLFGFIPIAREVTARVNTEAEQGEGEENEGEEADSTGSLEAAADVDIDYPWYAFLTSRPDTSRITAFLQKVAVAASGEAGAEVEN